MFRFEERIANKRSGTVPLSIYGGDGKPVPPKSGSEIVAAFALRNPIEAPRLPNRARR